MPGTGPPAPCHPPSGLPLCGFMSALMLACATVVHAGEHSEAQLKAGFLYNFVKYTEWPTQAAERVLCASRDSLTASALGGIDRLPLPGGELRVRTLDDPGESAGCDILYLGRTQQGRLATWLAHTPAEGVLTISDIEARQRPAVVIWLYTEGRRIRYDLHLGLAERAGLRFSPRLVNLADTLHREITAP